MYNMYQTDVARSPQKETLVVIEHFLQLSLTKKAHSTLGPISESIENVSFQVLDRPQIIISQRVKPSFLLPAVSADIAKHDWTLPLGPNPV